MMRTASHWRGGVAFAAIVSVALACSSSTPKRDPADSSNAPRGDGTPTHVDVARVLDLTKYMTAEFLATNGTCLPTDPAPAKSRLMYLMLPGESTYVRLNVVSSSDGARPEMIDLIRGLRGGRIWSATLERAKNTIVTQTFASASDHAPDVRNFGSDGPEGQRLREVAVAAMQVPCRS